MKDSYTKDELKLLVFLWKRYAYHIAKGKSRDIAYEETVFIDLANQNEIYPDMYVCADFKEDVFSPLEDVSNIEI